MIDDWSGFGQRTTASGTVVLDNVRVPASHVLPAQRVSDLPTLNGPLSQIIQAAIDAGIAKAALDDTLAFVRSRTPWVDSGVERAADDPLTIREVGHLHIQHAAEALLERAARTLDEISARGDVTEDDVARASVAVGEAKVLTTEIALLAGEAVRAGGHAVDAGRAQPRPALAQCTHAYAARSGALEISPRRQLLPERRAAGAPCVELNALRSWCHGPVTGECIAAVERIRVFTSVTGNAFRRSAIAGYRADECCMEGVIAPARRPHEAAVSAA